MANDAQGARRGRLKIYLGFAAGVGKTWRLIEEGRGLKARGADCVVGVVEDHGRAELVALARGLEVVPRRRVEYRGLFVDEMDVQAVVARRPTVVIVDEIAHTCAPGSKNRKRYEDVIDVCAAGIDVVGALNVQHLESVNEVVERVAGVAVRETVPDSFLDAADEVVAVDLGVEELLERMRAGKIYAGDKVERALAGFFQPAALATLRELALRTVAACVERTQARPALPAAASRRVLVCISAGAGVATIIQRGARMAGRLGTDWFAVYVEAPGEPAPIDAETQRLWLAEIEKARELGAEVVRLTGRDPVHAILDFARSHGVGQIIVGRARRPWWRGRSIAARLVREGGDLDVTIIGAGGERP